MPPAALLYRPRRRLLQPSHCRLRRLPSARLPTGAAGTTASDACSTATLPGHSGAPPPQATWCLRPRSPSTSSAPPKVRSPKLRSRCSSRLLSRSSPRSTPVSSMTSTGDIMRSRVATPGLRLHLVLPSTLDDGLQGIRDQRGASCSSGTTPPATTRMQMLARSVLPGIWQRGRLPTAMQPAIFKQRTNQHPHE